MTDDQILKEAIIKTGIEFYDGVRWEVDELVCYLIGNGRVFEFIFWHNFARRFWGEEPKMICTWRKKEGTGDYWSGEFPLWVYHLLQMVKDPEPLLYLKRFLKNGKNNKVASLQS